MKKLLGVITMIFAFVAFSLTAFAADKPVTIASASATTGKVTISGSSEALAVLVQVRDASDNILGMQSFGTVDGAFGGDIEALTLTDGATYTLYAADYEGGAWTTYSVTATAAAVVPPTPPTPPTAGEEEEEEEEKEEQAVTFVSPKTGDSNKAVLWTLTLTVGCACVAGCYVKKEKQ